MNTSRILSPASTPLRITVLIALCVVVVKLVSPAKNPASLATERLAEIGIRVSLSEEGVPAGLYLPTSELTDKDLADIESMNSLKSIQLDNIHCTDDLIRSLSTLSQVRSISLFGCHINDDQLHRFQHHLLEQVDLSRTTGLIQGLTSLGSQKALSRLVLNDCDWLTDNQLQSLEAFPALKTLTLKRTNITSDGLATLTQCKHLRQVDLHGCRFVNANALPIFAELHELESVSFMNTPMLLRSIVPFCEEHPRVQVIYSEGSAPDLQQLLGLVGFGSPENTWIDGVVKNISSQPDVNADLSILALLRNVQTLRLAGNGVDDRIGPILRQLTDLHSLDLSDSRVTDAMLSTLPVFEKLQSVSLENTEASRGSLQWLSLCPNLLYLNMSGTLPDASEYSQPLPFNNLKTLQLADVKTAMRVLNDIRAPGLSYINLNHCEIADNDMAVLNRFTSLSNLDLSANPITGSGLSVLHTLPIRELRLNNTRLNDGGMSALSTTHEFRVLDLSDTFVSTDGLEFLSTLRVADLRLRGFDLSSDATEALTQINGLRRLDLRHTTLDDSAWTSLTGSRQLTSLLIDAQSQTLNQLSKSSLATQLQTLLIHGTCHAALQVSGDFENLTTFGLKACVTDKTLANYVTNFPSIQFLELNDCELTTEVLQILLESGQFTSIMLSGNTAEYLEPVSINQLSRDPRLHVWPDSSSSPLFSADQL